MIKERFPGWSTLLDDDDQLYSKSLGEKRFHFIRVLTADKTVFVELNEVDLSAIPQKTIDCALSSCGPGEERDLKPETIAQACLDYGTSATLSSVLVKGKTEAEIRRAMNLSKEIQKFPAIHEWFMNQPVNKIGSTAREIMQGDLDAAMDRLSRPNVEKAVREKAGDPTDTEKVQGIVPGSVGIERRVQAKKLSSECMPVQVWGFRSCLTCEFRRKSSCGGKDIRKTGMNRNAIKVPV